MAESPLVISEEALEAITALASVDIDRASKKEIVAVPAGKRNKTLVKGQSKKSTDAPVAEEAPAEETTEEAAE